MGADGADTALSDPVLFGHDLTPGLVALHPLRSGAGSEQARMRVYQRQARHGVPAPEDVAHYPFLFLADFQALTRIRHRFGILTGFCFI
ncbi:MAG: hypothetical protein OXP66_15170 [Candidatus Tectomicrobia bacterium]|nr:hypothetical protein [Candidatus Tectomicrobia bacterium]